jgi:hypothetical protein
MRDKLLETCSRQCGIIEIEIGYSRLMSDTKPDIASINKAIIENPTGASNKEIIGLLELEDPALNFLCPLARAIYLADTGRLSKASAAEALATAWCIDDSFASDTSYTGSFAHVTESVLHEIEVNANNKTITLGFSSSSEMTHYTDFWDDYVRSAAADELELGEGDTSIEFVEGLFSLLDQQAGKGRPQGYPTDSGEFIGTSSYELISIGGLPVEGPTFYDSYHEQRWENHSSDYEDWCSEGEDDQPEGFYWLHYLTKNQAEQLGLTESIGERVDPDSGHPEWAPRNLLEEDSAAAWISTNMISTSYCEGRLQAEQSSCAYIALGCGSNWDPSSNPDEHEEVGGIQELTEYPEEAAPLYKIEIQRGSGNIPDELSRLLPYFKLFHAEASS